MKKHYLLILAACLIGFICMQRTSTSGNATTPNLRRLTYQALRLHPDRSTGTPRPSGHALFYRHTGKLTYSFTKPTPHTPMTLMLHRPSAVFDSVAFLKDFIAILPGRRDAGSDLSRSHQKP